MVPYNVDAQYSELHVLQKYSRNQFFVYVHPSSTVHLIFLFVSCFLIKEVDQNQTALCALWPGGNPILAAIFLWRLSALPFMTRCWCVMWWGTEMSVFWQGSQKQFLGNLNCSKLEITLKTSNQVISGFKFPATTASWTSAASALEIPLETRVKSQAEGPNCEDARYLTSKGFPFLFNYL